MSRFRVLAILLFAVIASITLIGMQLCWGDTIASHLAHPARLGVVVVTAVVIGAAGFYAPVSSLRTGRAEMLVHRQLIMPALAGCCLVGVLLISPWSDRRAILTYNGQGVDGVRYAGLVLNVIGAILSAWGPIHLGQHFSIFATVQDDHQLVTDGPYAIVRHPRYVGFAAWAVGVALVYRSMPGMGFALVIVALLLWRLFDEERVLDRAFGADWRAYCQRTHAFIPFYRSAD